MPSEALVALTVAMGRTIQIHTVHRSACCQCLAYGTPDQLQASFGPFKPAMFWGVSDGGVPENGGVRGGVWDPLGPGVSKEYPENAPGASKGVLYTLGILSGHHLDSLEPGTQTLPVTLGAQRARRTQVG